MQICVVTVLYSMMLTGGQLVVLFQVRLLGQLLALLTCPFQYRILDH